MRPGAREAGEARRAPKPARSRHCEWGAPSRSRGNSREPLSGIADGKAWAVATIHESGDLSRGRWHPTLSREKEWSMAPSRDDVAAADAGRRRSGGSPGAQEAGSGHRDRHEGRDPRRAGGRHRDRRHGDEIETRHYPTVDEALRNVPGVEIRRSGVVGKTTSHQHPRREPEPGAGAGGRRARQEPDPGPGRPGRHRARRRSSGSRSSAGRSRRSTAPTPSAASCNIITKKGQRAGHRVLVAGGRQLRHLPRQGGGERRVEGVRLLARLLPPRVQRPHHQRRHEPERGGRPLRPRPAVGQHADRWRRPLQQDRHRPAHRVRRQPAADRADDRSQHAPGERDVHGERRPAHAAGELVGGRDPRRPATGTSSPSSTRPIPSRARRRPSARPAISPAPSRPAGTRRKR